MCPIFCNFAQVSKRCSTHHSSSHSTDMKDIEVSCNHTDHTDRPDRCSVHISKVCNISNSSNVQCYQQNISKSL